MTDILTAMTEAYEAALMDRITDNLFAGASMADLKQRAMAAALHKAASALRSSGDSDMYDDAATILTTIAEQAND